jgi:hypothetical protein
MKIKLYTLILLTFSFYTTGQSYADITGAQRFSSSRALDDFSNLKSNVSENEKIDEIKGSMYFNANFEESTVVFNGVPLSEKTYLRYNPYNDYIEIGKNTSQTTASSILTKSENVEAQIGSDFYKAFSLNPKDKRELSYLVRIFSDQNHTLYLRMSKKFIDEKPAPSGIGGFLPARFEDKFKLFYSPAKKSILTELKVNKKSIAKLFPEDQSQLKKYISENNFKLKNYKDVLLIFEKFGNKQ